MNEYRKDMNERGIKALSVQSPLSREEFMRQCDEGKSPAVVSMQLEVMAMRTYPSPWAKSFDKMLQENPERLKQASEQYLAMQAASKGERDTTKQECSDE